MRIENIQAKTLIRTSNRSPHHIHMNLYQGCFHNCVYCNGTAETYHMHDDFGLTIKAKVNAPELLERYLLKEGYVPFNRDGRITLDEFLSTQTKTNTNYELPNFVLSLFGNVCDVYQPAEEELELTRTLLQIAYDFGVPVRLLTKSTLVLRDLDLLKKIHDTSFARVAFTITLADEEDQSNFEPNASSTAERLEALRLLRKEGIPSGAYITPIIPLIGDTEENLGHLFKKLQQINAEFVITGGLTLKPGRNKDSFMQVIIDKYPEYYSQISNLYSNNSPYGQPNSDVAKRLDLLKPVQQGYERAREYGINFYEPRFIPNVKYRKNLEVATYLARIGFLKEEIFRENYGEAREYRNAASKLEFLDKDIQEKSDSKIKGLDFPEYIKNHIIEIISTGKSNYLEEKNDFGELFYIK